MQKLILIIMLITPSLAFAQTEYVDIPISDYSSSYGIYSTQATFAAARDAESGTSLQTSINIGVDNEVANSTLYRTFLYCPIPPDSLNGGTIYNMRIVLDGLSNSSVTDDTLYVLSAHFGNASTAAFNDFDGWTSGSAHSGTVFGAWSTADYSADDNEISLYTALNDTATAYIGSAMKLALVASNDYYRTDPEADAWCRFDLSTAVLRVYLVDGSGGGDEDNTLTVDDDGGQDYTSISAAMAAAAPGDTILVYPGDYGRIAVTISNLLIRAVNAPDVTFPATGGDVPTGDAVNNTATYDGTNAYLTNPADVATTQGFVFTGVDSVTIDGFEITAIPTTGSTADTRSGVYFYNTGSRNVTFRNMYMHELAPVSNGGVGINAIVECDNMTITDSVFWRVEGQAIYLYGDDGVIDNNNISHGSTRNWSNGNEATSDTDAIRVFGDGHIITDNHLHDYYQDESPGQTPHLDAIQTYSPEGLTNTTIARNRIISGFDEAFMARDVDEDGGVNDTINNITFINNIISNLIAIPVNASNIANFKILHNTMYGVSGHSIYLWTDGVGAGCPNSVIKNNILVGGVSPNIDSNSRSGTVGDYNIFYDADMRTDYTDYFDNNGLLDSDPQFINASVNDYQLQANSPAIGFADSACVAYLVATDIDGSERDWLDGKSDAGAYLYAAQEDTTPDVTPTIDGLPFDGVIRFDGIIEMRFIPWDGE